MWWGQGVALSRTINLAGVRVEKRSIAPTHVSIHLPKLPPSTNNLYFNNAKHGRVMTPRYRTWRMESENALLQQFKARIPRTQGPVTISIAIQEPARPRDLDNCAKGFLDLFVTMKIIEADDNHIVRELHLAWSTKVTGALIEIRSAA